MKLALCLLLPLGVFAQSSSKLTPAAPVIDKVKLEAYLRHLEVWTPQINMKIDDPKPVADMPGFNKVMVHLSYNDARLDQAYFVSNDGQKIFKGEIYDLNKSPFQGNLDKIKTEQQPAFGAAAGAPVTLAVFGDFECPYCKEEANVLRQNIPAMFGDKLLAQPLGLTEMNARPGGSIRAFWEPAQRTSIPHSSGRHSMAPTPEMPSTTKTASVRATTLPMASTGWPVPVEVSDRVPKTAAASGCCLSASAT